MESTAKHATTDPRGNMFADDPHVLDKASSVGVAVPWMTPIVADNVSAEPIVKLRRAATGGFFFTDEVPTCPT